MSGQQQRRLTSNGNKILNGPCAPNVFDAMLRQLLIKVARLDPLDARGTASMFLPGTLPSKKPTTKPQSWSKEMLPQRMI